MISTYDPKWQVVQIGEATEKNIQIMFREKNLPVPGVELM
jgi:hypothetical protein